MKTIILKTENNINTYITSLTKEQYENLNNPDAKKNLPINYNDIITVGIQDHKNSYIGQSMREYIDSFEATTAGERQTHYRDYTKSKKAQKEMAWLINVGSDYRVSWRTVMIALNIPNYCVVWKDIVTKNYDYVREF